ncbi:UNVERIFIED_CONTAM: hypothetical protein PYX00_009840 [Menopon gallinae]|uniref:Uncharacterized protein n=1 Tax=Menopon gallinae TaxID=328185 RepID=A0AAW2HDH8_9NEOP
MTRLWNNIEENLLVLTLLTLVKASWTSDGHQLETSRKLGFSLGALHTNSLGDGSALEIVVETTANASTLQHYLSSWSGSVSADKQSEENTTYYGEGLPDVLFHSSVNNNSLILTDMTRCLQDFQLLTCMKFLLVNRLDDLLEYLRDNNLTKTDFSYAHGIVSFESAPGVNHYDYRSMNGGVLGLDEDITYKMMELFRDRSLQLNLFPGLGLDVAPVPGKSAEDFIGFRAKPFFSWDFWRSDETGSDENEGRKAKNGNQKKRKKGGFKMPSMMVMPQLIMWGTMPFVLANLQAMVMNAFMLNMMALNSAIFMTIRNLVFGPKGGPKIKYVNYGYKKKKSSVPTIIIHSPAAFVKQPFHKFRPHKRPHHHGPPPHHHQNHFLPPENVIVAEEVPTSYSDVHKFNDHKVHYHEGEDAYDDYHTEFGESEHVPVPVNPVRVSPEGQFHGKNRVRISVKEGGIGMRELLHRVRAAEIAAEGLPGVREPPRYSEPFDESASVLRDEPPWTASHQPTSHSFGETANDYNENEFRPMLTYPEKSVRHRNSG